ncbi:phosphoribosylaminoimidazole synthetase [Haemophilus influenzae]|uniref:phosphoribosylformylglycinamidine cyclo-ligase n=1 Tax=Haemophilus influenzae TaxID=727 RepID=A0A2X1PV21_HAEIF|nr:phosphoribosylaminoimidazole synthetase [Haemophilus influenzae]
MYHEGDYDLAGFCVGVVERSEIIDGTAVKTATRLSHSAQVVLTQTGYSLIRKVLEVSGANPADLLEGKPLSEHLLAPTKIYVKSILQLIKQTEVHAFAHLTGGGSGKISACIA